MWDVFISHAHEDKQAIADPLAQALVGQGYKVWYDDFELKIGQSLLQAIEDGLRGSRAGIVILSPDFFRKKWTKRELDGLFALEERYNRPIIPVWHHLTPANVVRFSPILAGKLAVSTSLGISNVVNKINDALFPLIHKKDIKPEVPDLLSTEGGENASRVTLINASGTELILRGPIGKAPKEFTGTRAVILQQPHFDFMELLAGDEVHIFNELTKKTSRAKIYFLDTWKDTVLGLTKPLRNDLSIDLESSDPLSPDYYKNRIRQKLKIFIGG